MDLRFSYCSEIKFHITANKKLTRYTARRALCQPLRLQEICNKKAANAAKKDEIFAKIPYFGKGGNGVPFMSADGAFIKFFPFIKGERSTFFFSKKKKGCKKEVGDLAGRSLCVWDMHRAKKARLCAEALALLGTIRLAKGCFAARCSLGSLDRVAAFLLVH